MSESNLLGVRTQEFYHLSHVKMLEVIRAGKNRKFGFDKVAYEVEEVTCLGNSVYNVTMQYTIKEFK